MFELPSSKRVRREDLYRSRSPSEVSADEPATQLLQSTLENVFGPVAPVEAGEPDVNAQLDESRDEEAQGFEFRLFSKPSGGPRPRNEVNVINDGPQRINIRTPTPETQNPGFIVPNRPQGCYIIGDLSATERDNFRIAAVSGEAVTRRAAQPCPGNFLPWRVVTLKKTALKGSARQIGAAEHERTSRSRAGKKRRILLRKRAAKGKEKKLREEEKKAALSLAEQEKRTRRNREKKVKKKAKEKLKKLGEKEVSVTD